MAKYQNVFDNRDEFDKLYNQIVEAIEEYSEHRKNNITYGEVIFVLESVLDSIKEKVIKENESSSNNDNISYDKTVKLLLGVIDLLDEKNVVTKEELEEYLRGE